MIGGVYHPRARGGAMSEALADAAPRMARLIRILIMRGAGLLLFLAAWRRLLALVSYHADDASLNNANGREVANLLGPLGAVAADLLLQTFGIAAVAFLAPPVCSGAARPARQKPALCHVAALGLAAGHLDRCGRAWAFSRRPPICRPALAA